MINDTQKITSSERHELRNTIRRYPLTSFQILNLYLNQTGLCISIVSLAEAEFKAAEKEETFTCPRCQTKIDDKNVNNYNPERTWIQCPDCGHRQPTKLFY